MANKELKLKTEKRAKVGSTTARQLRATGKVPAVLYGHGDAPQHIAFDSRTFDDLLHHGGRNTIISLSGDGSKDTALVREVQRNPVTHRLLHVDLQRVSANESVHAKLRIATVGTARGVKDFGGVMDVVLHEVEVEGPANAIPEHLEIDVYELGIHEHATAGDIKLPKGFKMITPPETIVVAIEPSKTAQLLEEAEAGAALEQAEPEMVGEQPEETPAEGA